MAGSRAQAEGGAAVGAVVGPATLTMASPIGPLALVSEDGALTRIGFDATPAALAGPDPEDEVLLEARRQLGAYFEGRLTVFDLPLGPHGTSFQRRVWDHLLTIAWGRTTTYGAIARALGMPQGASRAVGAANGANPLPVVVPCHRVIGADGTLTGYAGGLERKATLLRIESVPSEADQGVLF